MRISRAMVLLIITWLAFFLPLATGQVHFINDIKKLYYPLEVAYAQAQHAWQLPVWDPTFGFGQPLLAWGQLGFFTPLHLLLRMLWVPPLALLQVSMVAYYGLGMFGMYWWLRRYQLVPLAAAAGALVYTFGGFHVGHLTHVNFYVATMVLPYLLLAIHALAEDGRAAAIGWGGLAMGTILVSGHMQMAVYVVGIAAMYALVEMRAKGWWWLTARLAIMAILGLCIGAMAIFPLYEFWPQTDRVGALPQEELYEFSYPPAHAITLLFPFFFGDYHQYWGAKSFAELAGYTSLLPLLASGVALVAQRPQRLVAFAVMLAAVSFAIGLGTYSPIYHFLVERQIITSTAVPARLLLFFDSAIAILASCGLHALATAPHRHWRRYLMGAAVVPIGLLLPFGWQLLQQPAWQSRLIQQILGEAGMLLVASGLAFFLAIRRHLVLAVVVVGACLVIPGWRYNPLQQATQAYSPSPFVEDLIDWRQRTGAPARLYSRHHMMIAWQPTKPQPPALNTAERSLDSEVTSLLPDLQVTAGAGSVGWIGSLANKNFLAFTQTSLASGSPLTAGNGKNTLVTNRSALDAAGITHLIQTVPFDHDDLLPQNNFTVVHEVPSEEGLIRLYENSQAAPKVHLVGGSGTATIKKFDRTRITVAVQTDQPTTLVLTELATPQWQAAVDGQESKLLVADDLWRSVDVPAGNHVVTFWYHSPAVTLGLWLACSGLIISLWLVCTRLVVL